MRRFPILLISFLAFAGAAGAEPKVNGRPITIRAIEGLQFEPAQVKIDPGQTVIFRFINRDPSDQPHNLVIIKPGTLEEIQKASMEINPEAVARGYVPEHEAVIKATKLLEADKSQEFVFTAPEEPGVYQYVCTYPGHSFIMYGALYVGLRPVKIEIDQNIPEFARDRMKRLEAAKKELVRPAVKRFFMEKAGPAAIAVALENEMNYCWDAGNCRLRYAWAGRFINTGDNSRSNGSWQSKISGKEFWNGGGGELTYSIQSENPDAKPDFKGYTLIDGKPFFVYSIGKLKVTEFITSTSGGLTVDMKISNATSPVRVYAPGKVSSNAGTRQGDFITVSPEEAAELQLIIPAK
ncbi:MAG: plastocyanin/azurin family copper-binding protein [Luteolibacter sp.]